MDLQIVSMNYGYKSLRNLHFDKYISPKNPEDFVSLIANAEFVVADSFHGTAFSINFHKNFIAVPPEKFDSRLRSLVSVLEIEDRVYSSCMDIKKALLPIDYEAVEIKLNKERKKSLTYVEEAINE